MHPRVESRVFFRAGFTRLGTQSRCGHKLVRIINRDTCAMYSARQKKRFRTLVAFCFERRLCTVVTFYAKYLRIPFGGAKQVLFTRVDLIYLIVA